MPDRTPVSVIVVSFNEEANIRDCLESVTWADEIMVVDSFSRDRTAEIAREYTDRVLEHEYENHAAQCNWAIPRASHEWVFLLDCDERVTPGLAAEIDSLVRRGPEHEGYWVQRANHLFGRRVRFSGWGRDTVLRLFLRDRGRHPDKRVHPEIELTDTGHLRARLLHYTVASIEGWVAKINSYSSFKAEDKHEHGMRWPVLHLLLRPPIRFLKDFLLRLGILDGWRGFLIAAMSASAEMIMAAKVVQLRIQEPGGRRKKDG